jgi:FixJ family two-component response regulator
MSKDNPIVYVLDDDYRVREALTSLLSSVGLRVEVFASAAEYLKFQKAGLSRMFDIGSGAVGHE